MFDFLTKISYNILIMAENIVPFSKLPEEDQKTLGDSANWKVDGRNGTWNNIVDSRYGTFQHVAITDENGGVKFDKVNLCWTPGVYVVAVRINHDGKAEFLLPSERRILLRDEKELQGNVFVDGLPQGIIKVWAQEKPAEAARRELREETGYEPPDLVFLGNIAFNPANSESEQPFYLAHVPYVQIPKAQTLEESETIHTNNRWFTWNQIQGRPWRDGITIIGLSLAQRILKPELL